MDEIKKNKVYLGNDKELQVEGKGIIAIGTLDRMIKLIDDMQFILSLEHNLLNVGQLMNS